MATFSESGPLPTGLTFTGTAVSGTPSQVGTFPFTITGVDGNGCSGSTSYTLTIQLPDGSAPGNLIATAISTTITDLKSVNVTQSWKNAFANSSSCQALSKS